MMKQVIVWFVRIGVAGVLLFVALAFFTNVETSLTAEDITVFENEFGLRKPVRPPSYAEEVEIIRRVQAKVFAVAPFGRGIPENQSREPIDLVRSAQGMCYDRSRTLDKALAYMGFQTRHVYVLYREGEESFLAAMTRRGSQSHAVTEAKTSQGWLLVDSNSPWIAVTRKGEPVDADNIWRRIDEFDNVPKQLNKRWWTIRGMYSRDGKFYTPYIPFPEINWRDFLVGLREDPLVRH